MATSSLPLTNVGQLTISEAVWIATAILHREFPLAPGFTREQIADKVRALNLTTKQYRSIWQHIDQHAVANRAVSSGKTRMLFDVHGGLRRLFRPGDTFDPARAGYAFHPQWDHLPEPYKDLQFWYEQSSPLEEDPLLALRGYGADIWRGEDAVQHVRSLREG